MKSVMRGALFLAAVTGCGSDHQANGGAGATAGVAAGGAGGIVGVSSGGTGVSAGGATPMSGGTNAGTGGAGAGAGGGTDSGGAIVGSGGSGAGGASGGGVSAGGAAGAGAGGLGTSGAGGAAGGAGGGGGDGGATCTKVLTPSMDCAMPLAPGDNKECTVGTRKYFVYVPKNFNACEPAALVIDGHGATQTAASQLLGMPAFCTGTTCWKGPGSGWRLEAEAPGGGFILVTPSSATSGNTWDATADPPVMMQIIEAVKKVATVDPKKIYITGISNGAALSYWTACENPGVFAGISPNSGGVLGGAQCNGLSKPLNDIQFDDMPDFAFMDSQSSVTAMAKLDNCKEGPKDWKTIDETTTDPICLKDPDDNATTLVPCNTIMPAVQPTTCQIWDQCDGGTEVVFCKVAAGTLHGAANAAIDGHIIYENSTHLNTPSLAWRFFKSLW